MKAEFEPGLMLTGLRQEERKLRKEIMWRCPVCKTDNNTMHCSGCGFDGSCDYERYPTVDSLTGAPESIARRRSKYQQSRTDIQSCPQCGCRQFFLSGMSPICAQCGYRFAQDQQKWGKGRMAVLLRALAEKLKAACTRLFGGKKRTPKSWTKVAASAFLIALAAGLVYAAIMPGGEDDGAKNQTVSTEAESAEAISGDYVNVNLINTVEDPAHTYHVSALGLFERWSGENVIDLYNQAGEKKELTGSYEKADPMGQGFVRLSVKSEGENAGSYYALADCDGRILIPSAQSIRWITAEDELQLYNESDRYMLINCEEGLRIYDTKNKAMVENITFDGKSMASIAACGDSLVVNLEDGTAELYDEMGSQLQFFDRQPEVGSGYLLVNYSDNKRQLSKLYSETGTLLREMELDLTLIEGSGGYLKDAEYGSRSIYDSTGKKIISNTFYDILGEYQGAFLVEKKVADDWKYGLIRSDGTWVAHCEYDTCGSIWRDYCYLWTTDAKTTLVGPQGIIQKGISSSKKESLVCTSSGKLLVLNKKKYALECDAAEALTYGLAACQMAGESGYRIVDAFRGEMLTELVYEEVCFSNGFVFGYCDGSWHVYSVSYPDSGAGTVQ